MQEYELVGPSLYMDSVGKLYVERNGKKEPLKNAVTEAEERYVKRHLEGGTNSGKTK